MEYGDVSLASPRPKSNNKNNKKGKKPKIINMEGTRPLRGQPYLTL